MVERAGSVGHASGSNIGTTRSGSRRDEATSVAATATPEALTNHSGHAHGSGRYAVGRTRRRAVAIPATASAAPAASTGRPCAAEVVPSSTP